MYSIGQGGHLQSSGKKGQEKKQISKKGHYRDRDGYEQLWPALLLVDVEDDPRQEGKRRLSNHWGALRRKAR
jgi:hypothetical protein